jgi:hypothetical protein
VECASGFNEAKGSILMMLQAAERHEGLFDMDFEHISNIDLSEQQAWSLI